MEVGHVFSGNWAESSEMIRLQDGQDQRIH